MNIFRWFRNFQKRRALAKSEKLEKARKRAMEEFRSYHRNALLTKYEELHKNKPK